MWWMLVLAAAVGEMLHRRKAGLLRGAVGAGPRRGTHGLDGGSRRPAPLGGGPLRRVVPAGRPGFGRRGRGAAALGGRRGLCPSGGAGDGFFVGGVSGRRVLCLLGGCGAVVLLPAFGMDIPLGPVGALTPVLLLLGGVELTYRRELRRPPARALADGPLRGPRLWWRVGVLAVAAFLGGLFLCCGLSHLLGEGAASPLWAALFLGGAPLGAGGRLLGEAGAAGGERPIGPLSASPGVDGAVGPPPVGPGLPGGERLPL